MTRQPPFVRRAIAAAPLVALLALAGCGGEQDELQAWMQQQSREVKPNVEPLQAPKRFDPQAYLYAEKVDPFNVQKLSAGSAQQDAAPNPLLAGELNRRKEPLEAYPLDAMRMVGSVRRGGRPFALLEVDKLLYQVAAGDHLGQNYGRITSVNETEVVLREIVQDAAGEWIERSTSLQLQERAR